MKINLSAMRDLAVTGGALALLAMAADDLGLLPTRPRRKADALPAVRNGWLYSVDGLAGDRVRRLRPATPAEVSASAASLAAGEHGWFGLTADGEVIGVQDARFITHAGREWGPNRVDVVYVTDSITLPPVPAGAEAR
ncbi:hypothetical protein [Frankia sp. Cas3]|uniref:hypothetical protein n=1 Tax=Frankia sp. Cas3 TaxID=3073926 RepID=UPI002AD4910F|nr:hypothetical protein [Frankia sp. Cas3]